MPRPTVVPTMKVARGSHLLICSSTCCHRGCPNTTPRSRPVGKLALRSDAGIFFTVPVWLLALVRGRHSCPTTQQGNLMSVHPLSPRIVLNPERFSEPCQSLFSQLFGNLTRSRCTITFCSSTSLTLPKAGRDVTRRLLPYLQRRRHPPVLVEPAVDP